MIFHCANGMNSMNELTSTQSLSEQWRWCFFFLFLYLLAVLPSSMEFYDISGVARKVWVPLISWRWFMQTDVAFRWEKPIHKWPKILIVRNAENTQSICCSIACEISIHNSLLFVHTRSGILWDNPFVVLHRLQAVNFVKPCRKRYLSVHQMPIQLRLISFHFSSFLQLFDAIVLSGVSPIHSCVTDSFTITSLWCTLRCTLTQWPFRNRLQSDTIISIKWRSFLYLNHYFFSKSTKQNKKM